MKITALLPDDLVDEVRKLTKAKNTTESLISALSEWVAIQRIKELNKEVEQHPLVFEEGFSATSIRGINRS